MGPVVAPTIPDVGWIDGLDPETYHRHPALSSSRTKLLIPPSTPAHYRWSLDHPVKVTREMLMGTATHTEVLGAGQDWTILPGEDRRTKAVKDREAEIVAAGEIALTPSEAEAVMGMAAAVKANDDAATLLRQGTPERAIFWRDHATGIACRGLIDWSLGRRALVDLKTTGKDKASRAKLPRLIADWHYDIQAAHYLRGAVALDLIDPDALWVWIVVEREPPHPVAVVTLDPRDLADAHDAVSRAYRLLADCTEADYWPSTSPGYPTGIQTITLPPWSRRDTDIEEFELSW